MQNFHDFYFGIPVKEREAYVKKAGTTISYAERLAGGFRFPSMRMAKRLIKAAKDQIDYNSFVKTWESRNGPIS